METIKTLWQLLQEVVENQADDRYFSLYDFIDEENHFWREDIKKKLEKAEQKQFFEYMDWFNFVNQTEVYMAVCEYTEKVMNRPLCMWELGDMSEVADYYISEKNLKLDDDWNILPYNL